MGEQSEPDPSANDDLADERHHADTAAGPSEPSTPTPLDRGTDIAVRALLRRR